jgi:hypothetical protein
MSSGRLRGRTLVHEPPDEDLDMVFRPLPPRFERRVVTLAAGQRRPYDEAEWEDALVVVEAGAVELEGLSGRRFRFERGDILWLAGVPLRELHNPGPTPVVLVALRRRDRCR